jgi:hypothetical protein
MKLAIRVAVVLFILSSSLQVFAQADPNYDQRMLYSRKYYKFKNMKTTGIVMTVGGVLLAVAAANKINHSGTVTYTQGQNSSPSDPALAGEVMFLFAEALIGAGVPLTIVGSITTKKYGRLMENIRLGGRATPRGFGVGLTYRF